MSVFHTLFEDFPGTKSFFAGSGSVGIVFAWIRIRIKVQPGSGSVTNFFTSWIRIRFKMIRIRNTASRPPQKRELKLSVADADFYLWFFFNYISILVLKKQLPTVKNEMSS